MLKSAKYILFLFIVFVVCSCASKDKIGVPRSLEMIYNPSSSSIHPVYKIFNSSDTSAIIIGEIDGSELLYNKQADESRLTAQLRIIYNLYDLDKKERLVDSLTTNFILDKKNEHKIEISFKAVIGQDYILEIITTDKNRNSNHYSFFTINRTDKESLSDFQIIDLSTGSAIHSNNIAKYNTFEIRNYKKSMDSLNVFYFKKYINVPKPPNNKDSVLYNFSVPDSSWVIYNDSIEACSFNQLGSYYITTLSEPKNGFALYNFGESFPEVKYPNELLEPLSYLGLNDTISQSDSLGKIAKLMVDDFWLDVAQNVDRSRDLLRIYYNRVINANKYFSSFVEGWKTDRGMIYIIYGLPDYIFKSDLEEEWIYSPIDLGPGYSFKFKYYENPFSLNHYILERSKLKDTGWESMIKMWKKGEIIYYQK